MEGAGCIPECNEEKNNTSSSKRMEENIKKEEEDSGEKPFSKMLYALFKMTTINYYHYYQCIEY